MIKPIPTDPHGRVQYFTTQLNLLKAKRAPDALIAAVRAKLADAKRTLPPPATP